MRSPQGRSKSRFTLGQLMAAIAIVALLLAARADRAIGYLVVGVVAGFGIAWLARTICISIWGDRCPHCLDRTMRRMAVDSFAYRFYRCESCLRRFKRHMLGFAWLDASGPADDPIYAVEPEVDPWGGGMIAGDDQSLTGMTGSLLRNKRHRGQDARGAGDDDSPDDENSAQE